MKKRTSIQPATVCMCGAILFILSVVWSIAAIKSDNPALLIEILLFLLPASIIGIVVGAVKELERREEVRLYTRAVAESDSNITESYESIELKAMRECELALACHDYKSIINN